MQMICQATCYMPVRRGGKEVSLRFEDGDIADVPKSMERQYLGTGNFHEVAKASEVENPILVVGPAEDRTPTTEPGT